MSGATRGHFYFPLDMILTDEWSEEVSRHEKIIKDLQKRYTEKCEALKVIRIFSKPSSSFVSDYYFW